MRAITVLCATIALVGLTSVASAQCTEEPVPPQSRKVARPVKGIAPVKIVFAADKSDSTKPDRKLNTTFRFWIDGHVRVLFDRRGFLQQVHHCALSYGPREAPTKRTYVKVWYRPQPGEGEVQDGDSALLLPMDVVARKPKVGVTFDSGTSLVGTWDVSKEKGETMTVLRLAEPE